MKLLKQLNEMASVHKEADRPGGGKRAFCTDLGEDKKLTKDWKDVTCKNCLTLRNSKKKGGYRSGASPLWNQS